MLQRALARTYAQTVMPLCLLDEKHERQERREPEKVKNRLSFQSAGILFGISAAAIAVHGYHPYVEDAEIYLPGIKKLLNPTLYAQNTGFFASHAGMTMFPKLIAASVRVTHLPFDWALLAWQFLCIYFLLLGCWKIGRLLFDDPLASWGGVGLLASLLTIPVAGTALYIMDQYLSTRSLSGAAVPMMVADAMERRYLRAACWAVVTVAVHPLMFVFGTSFVLVHFLVRRFAMQATGTQAHKSLAPGAALSVLLPFGLFPPMSPAYHEVLLTRSYFFLSRWEWFEWLGMVAPFAIFWWFGSIARRRGLTEMQALCRAANIFGLIFALASLLTVPAGFERFTLLQPMRYLHLTYVLMFVVGGGLLAEYVLQRRLWRWLLLFVPLCAGMLFAQRQTFPATSHLELPGLDSHNSWVQAFLWIRENTPSNAYFAVNPEHMRLTGEDQHGFRALAERSMLADLVKDSGSVSMFPNMAETWKEQTTAQSGWKAFGRADFARLLQRYGVDWVVLDRSSAAFESPSGAGLECPYSNSRLRVCRIE